MQAPGGAGRGSSVPPVDDGVRRRLMARFGPDVETWFAELPTVLLGLAERWHLEWGSPIPRGSMSVVLRCTLPGQRAVLKVSPDRARLSHEAAALQRWTTVHTPAVLAVDEHAGALLIEEITPGTPLVESLVSPTIDETAGLLTALQHNGFADPSYPPLAHRVEHLFTSGVAPYQRNPDLRDLVAQELYERGHRLATRLAESVAPTALLHGDLTPSNILDGGAQRGLVGIDPAPCLGDDLAFDAIDLLLWQATDVDTITTRAVQLAPAIGTTGDHLLEWCTAFAAMTALELAEVPNMPAARIQTYLRLAAQAAS